MDIPKNPLKPISQGAKLQKRGHYPFSTRRITSPRYIASFESKVNRDGPGGCWEWTGTRNDRNYGVFSIGLTLNASRASWLIYRGDIPVGMEICHTCDRGWCVNPDHLFVGTHAQNMADASRKGRMRPAGYKRKIDKDEMVRMLANGATRQEVADRFGVTPIAVSSSISRLTARVPLPSSPSQPTAGD